MRTHFVESPEFTRKRERLLSEAEFDDLTARLYDDPEAGTSLGGNLFKIRVGRGGQGRRGGARVIYGLRRANGVIVFLDIFGKNAESDLTPAELAALKKAFARDG